MRSRQQGQIVLAGRPSPDGFDGLDGVPPRLSVLLDTADRVASDPTPPEVADLLDAAAAGSTVVVLLDAVAPGRGALAAAVVQAATARGVEVTAVPSPSTALAALAQSGLATDRFCVEGRLPDDPQERSRALAQLAQEGRTMVFEAPVAVLEGCLRAMADTFGATRPAAALLARPGALSGARRGTLAALATWAAADHRPDEAPTAVVTLVVGGCPVPVAEVVDVDDLAAAVRARVATGERLKDAVAAVAAPAGYPKRALYDAVTRG